MDISVTKNRREMKKKKEIGEKQRVAEKPLQKIVIKPLPVFCKSYLSFADEATTC